MLANPLQGSDRIGTQESIPLPRRVQLAVLAHVRHTKTDYDNLLKTVGWQGARRLVEQSCLDQIVRWRGETDEGDGELEDIFQEVIVLDDDDDDDTQDLSDRHGHESSVEIIADQRHPEDVDVDAYSPPPLTTRQSIPREPPRSESPAIISVKPIRAPRPPPLLTRDAFNQRLQDTKQRVGHEHGDAPLLSLNGQPRAVVAQSHEGQASDKRQMPAVNGFRYVSDSAAALERSHHDSSSHPEAPRRPPQPQVYRSIEGQSDQQRRGWRPEAMQTGLPQRSLPGLNPMPRHSGNPTPRERSPPHNKPMTALAEHVGTRNGYHARDEVPSQRVPRPLRAGRDREVIDLTRTSPVATKAAADMRVNTRPTSVTRPRTRSRSPDRRPMYYERALRPVEDTRDGRYLAYPQYRDRMDPPHRQPLSGIESNGQRLYEIDAVGRRLQDYAMYDDNDDDVRRPPRRLRELQQAPPRSRSAGHHVLREEPERLHDHDIRYADRATRSRQYLPLEDWEPSTVRYRDMGDPYPVDRRPM